MESRLVLDVFRLSPSGEALEGEVRCVDLDEEFVKPAGAARYRLEAKLYGTELLVRGHLEQDFVLACSRCGRDFTTTIAVEDSSVHGTSQARILEWVVISFSRGSS